MAQTSYGGRILNRSSDEDHDFYGSFSDYFIRAINNPVAAEEGGTIPLYFLPLLVGGVAEKEAWWNNELRNQDDASGGADSIARLGGRKADEFARRIIRAILNPGAAGGVGTVHLYRSEVVEAARWINVLLNRDNASGVDGIARLAGWEVDELARRINVILNQSGARRGESGTAHLTAWEVIQLVAWINANLNPDADRSAAQLEVVELARYVLFNLGAAEGNEGGTAHLPGMQIIPEVERVNQNNVLVNRSAAAARGVGGGTSHLPGIQIIQRENQNNVLRSAAATRGVEGGTSHYPEIRFIQKENQNIELLNWGAGRGVEGGTSHYPEIQFIQRENQNIELLNWGAGRGVESGTSYSPEIRFIQRENQNIELLNRDPAGTGEGGTSHLPGICESELGWISNHPEVELENQNNVLPNQDAATGGNEVGTPQIIYEVELANQNNVLSNQDVAAGGNEFGTPQIIHEVELANQNNVLPNQDAAAGGNELPDSMPLNLYTSPANYPPGSAPGTSGPRNRASSTGRTGAAESHTMDIKDEEPQHTDFVIQEPDNKILGFSTGLAFSLYVAAMQNASVLIPKYYSKTILGLLAISLTCMFCIGVFYKKLPAKFVTLATYLAIACNASALFLLMGFFFAKI